jgi:hypothetical protein
VTHARLFRSALVCALALSAACSSSPSEPVAPLAPTVGDSSLLVNALRPAVGAPTIANPVVSFYAKVGEDRQAFMYYRKRATRNDSTVFLRFRVRRDALLARPNGSSFAPGDSILITMTLVDPERLIVNFAPSGLRFSSANPAELKMNFFETDDDLDDDGSVDTRDTAIQTLLAVWKREGPSLPWVKQLSRLTASTEEIETDVVGFTDYVIAW